MKKHSWYLSKKRSKITMNTFRVKINLLLYFVVNFMIIMVILVFFMVISVNRRLFRYFGSYSGISVIPVILVNRRTGQPLIFDFACSWVGCQTTDT